MNVVAAWAPPTRLKLPEPVANRFGIDAIKWKALVETIYPNATSIDSVVMALSYCEARNLDPFKRPVHIVPIWSKATGGMVDTVWPGISELRTTAMRTSLYAGKDKTDFGPDVTATLGGVEITYPEWAQVTVYRMVPGIGRCPFEGPTIFWTEAYATAKRDTQAPNDMWKKRPRGQLDKCAEAAALRAAFPEEIGNEYAAEEVEGQAFTARDVTPRESPNLAARLAAPTDAATEGFTVHNGPDPDDQIPDFDAAPPVSDEALTTAADDAATVGADSFPGDVDAAEVVTTADPVIVWQRRLIEDMDGLSLEQLDHLLANPSDQEMFGDLERDQPQLAMDLNKAITRRRKELGA